jgi:hypothetical protein
MGMSAIGPLAMAGVGQPLGEPAGQNDLVSVAAVDAEYRGLR